jgi:hypothetical protein
MRLAAPQTQRAGTGTLARRRLGARRPAAPVLRAALGCRSVGGGRGRAAREALPRGDGLADVGAPWWLEPDVSIWRRGHRPDRVAHI